MKWDALLAASGRRQPAPCVLHVSSVSRRWEIVAPEEVAVVVCGSGRVAELLGNLAPVVRQ